MQFQIYSITHMVSTKVFNVLSLNVRLRKNHKIFEECILSGICRIKCTNVINLCKNKHIACEKYETYAKIFMKFDIKETENEKN